MIPSQRMKGREESTNRKDNRLEDSEEAASGVEGREDSASMMDTQLLESGEAVPIMGGRMESANRMGVQKEDSGELNYPHATRQKTHIRFNL